MKTPTSLVIATAVAAALSGCASGGGGNEPMSEQEVNVLLCAFLPFTCMFGPRDSAQSTAGVSADSPQQFVSWSKQAKQYLVTPVSQSLEYRVSGSAVQSIADAPIPLASEVVEIAVPGVQVLPSSTRMSAAGQPAIEVTTLAGQGPFSGDRAALAANPYDLGWNYQSFGVWTRPLGSDRGTIESRSFGSVSPGSAVPLVGTAQFTGKLAGLHVSPAGTGRAAVAELSVGADFGARTLSFASSQTRFSSGAAAPQLDLSGTLTYSAGSNAFSGTLISAGGALKGSSTGQFYGPAAQELGGVFTVKSATSMETFTGAYGAKR